MKFLSILKENKVINSIAKFFVNFQKKRTSNSEKYTMTNRLLCIFFPIFIVMMAELNQGKYPSKLILFIAHRPTVMLFNIIISALIFIGFYLLLKRGWLAMFIQSCIYMVLSATELFKYNTNGNHLTITDMSLAKSLESLTSFAYIKITIYFIVYIAIVLLYLGFTFWFNPRINVKFYKAFTPSVACLGVCALIMTVPSFGNKVYALFDVDTAASKNTFILNEKFENNGFLAFFMQDSTETVENKLKEPEDYDKQTVEKYLNEDSKDTSKTDYTMDKDKIHPNVIVVMSESYADFRVFDSLNIDDDVYKGFDEVCAKKNSYSGHVIVPTYASYTVRTEFELMFGLPVKSMNDASMPQRLLLDRKQATIPSYYKANGYATDYIHPYLGTFYGRNYIYSNYSFDNLIFEDDFTVNEEYHGNYIDDKSVFDQAEKLIKDNDKPTFIHCTTMQNHQPYNVGGDDEFKNYLSGIQHTSEMLKEFTDELDDFDEPTIVFFVGDHFPSLRGEDGIYSQIGITSKNCSTVYEQHYVIYANYDVDYSIIPDENFSVFYMPYLLMDMANLKGDNFTKEMNQELKDIPIYSTNYRPSSYNNDELDVLTYDRCLGNQLSDSPLNTLYPEEITTSN